MYVTVFDIHSQELLPVDTPSSTYRSQDHPADRLAGKATIDTLAGKATIDTLAGKSDHRYTGGEKRP